jgi:hypothetical protein
MRNKGLLLAVVVAAALLATSSALARHSHARHRHGLHSAALVSPTTGADDPADCTTGTKQNPGLGITGASTLIYASKVSGTASDGTLTITVTTPDSITFDFSAALPAGDAILAIFADAHNQPGNLYDYRPIGGVLSDTGLHAPGSPELSHILFCYGPKPTGTTGPTGPTGTTGTTGSTGSGGITTTAPSTVTSPPVTPFTAPSTPKSTAKAKKLKHHAPRRARRTHAFTG